MWAIRILSGSQMGQILPLRQGKNIVGRSPNCNVKVASAGISKEHCEINVFKDKIMISDLRSSNGTFVNGVKIQNQLVRIGDKIALHDVFCDIIPAPEVKVAVAAQHQMPVAYNPNQYPMTAGNNAMQVGYEQQMAAPSYEQGQTPQQNEIPKMASNSANTFFSKFTQYVDDVAMPGIYKLGEFAEMKVILGGFLVAFIFIVTALSMIPMAQITNASIEQESRRRALSIALRLAADNQAALAQGLEGNLNTSMAEAEDGVKSALIISQANGMILAPAVRSGSSPDLPFVHKARRESKDLVENIDGSTIGASAPIAYYSAELGSVSVRAHAVVIYDMGSLAFNEGRAFSLFIQTFVVAVIVGLLAFFFMYRLIEFPIRSLNEMLDTAMREGRDNIQINFQFPVFQDMVSNINSLLTRALHGGGQDGGAVSIGRVFEGENLVQLIGYAAVAINRDLVFTAANAVMESSIGLAPSSLIGKPVSSIPDSALQQNLNDLLARSKANPQNIETNNLEFSGVNHTICCQAILATNGEVEYFVLTFVPLEGGG